MCFFFFYTAYLQASDLTTYAEDRILATRLSHFIDSCQDDWHLKEKKMYPLYEDFILDKTEEIPQSLKKFTQISGWNSSVQSLVQEVSHRISKEDYENVFTPPHCYEYTASVFLGLSAVSALLATLTLFVGIVPTGKVENGVGWTGVWSSVVTGAFGILSLGFHLKSLHSWKIREAIDRPDLENNNPLIRKIEVKSGLKNHVKHFKNQVNHYLTNGEFNPALEHGNAVTKRYLNQFKKLHENVTKTLKYVEEAITSTSITEEKHDI